MADEDTDYLAREAAALRAVNRAMEPWERKVGKIEDAFDRLVETGKADIERAKVIASEDRARLAQSVKEDAKAQAEEVAKEVVNQMMISLDINPEKISDFRKDMMFVRELRETFGTAKRHAITVVIGVIMMGIISGVWMALKSGVAKP